MKLMCMKPISRSPERHAYGEARNGIDRWHDKGILAKKTSRVLMSMAFFY